MSETLELLRRFFRVPGEPLEEAAARGDALVGWRELDAAEKAGGMESVFAGRLVHPWGYVPARSYLGELTGLCATDLARVARYEAYLRLGWGAYGAEVVPAAEARREIERDPDQQYSLLTGAEAVGQWMYSATSHGALREAEAALARAEAESPARLFPPATARRAWRLAHARRRAGLWRVFANSDERREALLVDGVPVASGWAPWSERREKLEGLYARLRATQRALSGHEPGSEGEHVVLGEAQRWLEEVCAAAAVA